MKLSGKRKLKMHTYVEQVDGSKFAIKTWEKMKSTKPNFSRHL